MTDSERGQADATRPYRVACDLYLDALAILAQRAGATGSPDAPAVLSRARIEAAQALALPKRRASRSAQPVLASIMGRLHGENKPGYYAPSVMRNQAVIPLDAPPGDLAGAYAGLWRQLQAEQASDSLPEDAHAAAIIQERRLHAALQRYTWAVAAPPTSDDPPDAATVSLYDYARVAAALAVCQDWTDPTGTAGSAADAGAESVLLVGGDLSGVQEWLYTFGSAGAAKSLRGRSFYLQLLTEVIAHFMLDSLGLPVANLLYVGGGNFYLLAPALLADRMNALRQGISRKLLTMHSGALYVAVAHAPLPLAALTGEEPQGIGRAWDQVARKLNGQKNRRFAELTPAEMARAIGATLDNTGLPEDTCRVCRRSITAQEKGKAVDDTQGGRTCDLCLSFQELGNLLPKAKFLVLDRVPAHDAELVTEWEVGLRQLGYGVQPVHDAHDAALHVRGRGGYTPPADTTWTTVYYWADELARSSFPGAPDPDTTIWAFRPLAQCTPLINAQEIATFEELNSEGIARWGVLRMDVDNLGRIFQAGIPTRNLCGVAAVSGLMRHFFEGYVPGLAEQRNEIGDPRVYLMYAGGDDLFVVGGWSELPRLADEIRRSFARFVCGNPQVTISGGISIALDDHYPLYQAAAAAGAAEDAAKDHGKDALAFLGQAMQWHTEFEQVDRRRADIGRWLGASDSQGPRMARSFLMALRSLAAEWERWRKQEAGPSPAYQNHRPDLYLGPWQWHLVYSLSRAVERAKDPSIETEVKAYIEALLAGEIRTAGVTARWVELLTRSQSES